MCFRGVSPSLTSIDGIARRHVFCSTCLDQWLCENSQCPVCRSEVDNVTPDRFAAALIANLPSFCPLRKNGCPWMGKHGDRLSHLGSCPCVIVRCPTCEEEVPQRALFSHVACCAAKACPWCNERTGAADMETHMAECLLDPRKLLAALQHVQRENERLALINHELRAKQQQPRSAEAKGHAADIFTPPQKRRRRATTATEDVDAGVSRS